MMMMMLRVNTCNTRVPTIGGLDHISHSFQGLHIAFVVIACVGICVVIGEVDHNYASFQ